MSLLKPLRLLAVAILPMVLTGCLLSPGKFISNLTINADRSFTFSYQGEVIALDLGKEMGKGLSDTSTKSEEGAEDTEADKVEPSNFAEKKEDADIGMVALEKGDKDSLDSETKNKAIAEALSKEYGYRSVKYQGKGKFLIDYQISGTLTHNFIYPFNADAEAVFPFLVVELRQGNTVRVKAPGFANDKKDDTASMSKSSGGDALDGVFTLDTDAEVVSQNNEDGATKKGKRSVISWKATPLTKDAPTAVLRLAK